MERGCHTVWVSQLEAGGSSCPSGALPTPVKSASPMGTELSKGLAKAHSYFLFFFLIVGNKITHITQNPPR